MPKNKSKNIVKITWRDIAGITSANNAYAWLHAEQMMKDAQRLFNQEYTTTGEIVGETKDFIVIAATCDNAIDDDPLYSDASMIMKSVIIKTENYAKK